MSVCEWVCARCGYDCRDYSGKEICHNCKLRFGEPFTSISFLNRLRGKYD